jgi:hypothetical protein
MTEYTVLTQFLRDNIRRYGEEYGILTGEKSPDFIKKSLEIKELIQDDTYFLCHDFPVREHFKRCYYISMSGVKTALGVLENIIDGCARNAEGEEYTRNAEGVVPYNLISDTYLGDKNLSCRNYYGCYADDVNCDGTLPGGFEYVEVNGDNISLLSEIAKEDEEFYSNIKSAVGNEDFIICAALYNGNTAAYAGFKPDSFDPTVYTGKAYRLKNIAYALLSHCIRKYFRGDKYITYGADSSNIASNNLAKKLGLRLLNTSYFYTNS